MRILVVLILIGAAVGGGWWWFKGRAEPVAQAQDPGPFVTTTPSIQPVGLPAEVQRLIDGAEADWTAAGDAPQRTPKAPALARQCAKALRALYDVKGSHDRQAKLIAERAQPLADVLFFSKAKVPADDGGLFALHLVAPGESPEKIGIHYGMSRELVNTMRGADINNGNLQAGESLKVVNLKEAGHQIHIDKGQKFLDWYIAGIFARRYQISIGAVESPTPVGKTKITKRQFDPEWTNPKTGKVLAAGDPENILGGVWLAFDEKQLGQKGIGIHGYTGANGGLGRMISNGCIRMANDEVKQFAHWLSQPDRTTTTVEIVE